ncbi:MAG: hypothetical protein JWP97_2327 [Labilithrix sp.]|nr:hypothetical protein [Labilithrix sp.]
MMRVGAGVILLAALAGRAPMQCGHGGSAGTEAEHEGSPGDALWSLAQDFETKGNHDAARQTLETLVAKYPSNRHVPAARDQLAAMK